MADNQLAAPVFRGERATEDIQEFRRGETRGPHRGSPERGIGISSSGQRRFRNRDPGEIPWREKEGPERTLVGIVDTTLCGGDYRYRRK